MMMITENIIMKQCLKKLGNIMIIFCCIYENKNHTNNLINNTIHSTTNNTPESSYVGLGPNIHVIG